MLARSAAVTVAHLQAIPPCSREIFADLWMTMIILVNVDDLVLIRLAGIRWSSALELPIFDTLDHAG